MEFSDVSKKIGKNKNISVIADTHWGLKASSESTVKKALKIVEDYNDALFLGGDLTESRCTDHPYFSQSANDGRFALIQDQIDYAVEMLRPYRKRIIGVMQGNHELDNRVKKVIDVSKAICKALNIDCVNGCISAKLKIGDDKMFFHHGRPTINSQAGDPEQCYNNDVRKIRRFLRNKAGDCIVMGMGHIHKVRIGRPIPQLALVGDTSDQAIYTNPDMYRGCVVPETQRFYFSTGSFLKTRMEGHITYSDAGGYDPTEMGFVRIIRKNNRVVDLEPVIV